jgi:hypothetical protein
VAVKITLRIAGHMDQRWADWFEGLALHHLPDGSTELSGQVIDQTALYGLLSRARDLGMTLLTVSVETAGNDDESLLTDLAADAD